MRVKERNRAREEGRKQQQQEEGEEDEGVVWIQKMSISARG